MDDNLRQGDLISGAVRTRFGSFDFDPRRHELRRRGRRVSMSASQLRLLSLFMERPGELITRDEIAARLWTDTRNIDVASGINTAINRLRRHLQETPGGPSCIETVIGLGYRFVSDLELTELGDGAKELPDVPLSLKDEIADLTAPETDLQMDLRVLPGTPAVSAEVPRAWHTLSEEPTSPYGDRSAAARPSRWIPVLALGALVLLSALIAHEFRRWPFLARNRNPATAPGAYPANLDLKVPVTAEAVGTEFTATAVSPSGQSVAYGNRFGVSVHWFATGAERLLGGRPSFTVSRLVWLPDESGLLMSGTDEILHRQQVWSVPLQGAYLQLLVEDANRATVSPDGSQIAFTRAKDQELWLAAIDGQRPRRLRNAETGAVFDLLLWNPAGNRLVVTQRHEPMEGKSTGPADSSGQSGVYECIDPASGQVLEREEGFAPESGYMLPDGRFYFAENKTPGPATGAADLMMVMTDPNSGRFLDVPKRVHPFGARKASSLTASTNGMRIAAVLYQSETDVYLANLRKQGPELTDVVRLTRGAKQNFPHSWAPDGKGVLLENDSLIVGGSSRKWAIFNQPLDGSKPALVASLPQDAAMAQLSPDGQWILFLQFTGHPQHASGIFRVPAAGGRVEQIPTHGNIEEFHCSTSPAGRCVLRETVGTEALVYYSFNPVQGMGQELARTPWQPNRLGDWGLSADGSTVATTSHDTLRPGVSLLRLDGKAGKVQEIPLQAHGTTLGASWAPDGRSLFVECRTETGFELVSLDLAGHVRLLRQSPSLIWAVPSRDGKKVAFPSLTISSSVWASDVTPDSRLS